MNTSRFSQRVIFGFLVGVFSLALYAIAADEIRVSHYLSSKKLSSPTEVGQYTRVFDQAGSYHVDVAHAVTTNASQVALGSIVSTNSGWCILQNSGTNNVYWGPASNVAMGMLGPKHYAGPFYMANTNAIWMWTTNGSAVIQVHVEQR